MSKRCRFSLPEDETGFQNIEQIEGKKHVSDFENVLFIIALCLFHGNLHAISSQPKACLVEGKRRGNDAHFDQFRTRYIFFLPAMSSV